VDTWSSINKINENFGALKINEKKLKVYTINGKLELNQCVK